MVNFDGSRATTFSTFSTAVIPPNPHHKHNPIQRHHNHHHTDDDDYDANNDYDDDDTHQHHHLHNGPHPHYHYNRYITLSNNTRATLTIPNGGKNTRPSNSGCGGGYGAGGAGYITTTAGTSSRRSHSVPKTVVTVSQARSHQNINGWFHGCDDDDEGTSSGNNNSIAAAESTTKTTNSSQTKTENGLPTATTVHFCNGSNSNGGTSTTTVTKNLPSTRRPQETTIKTTTATTNSIINDGKKHNNNNNLCFSMKNYNNSCYAGNPLSPPPAKGELLLEDLSLEWNGRRQPQQVSPSVETNTVAGGSTNHQNNNGHCHRPRQQQHIESLNPATTASTANIWTPIDTATTSNDYNNNVSDGGGKNGGVFFVHHQQQLQHQQQKQQETIASNNNINNVVNKNGKKHHQPPQKQRHRRSTSVTAPNKCALPLRLVVIGSGGVGKSAITIQFIQQYFILEYDPTIADTYSKNVFLDGELLRLEVYDTAGQDEFSAMRDPILKTGDGFLLVFSITNRESLSYVHKLHDHVERFKDRDSFPMIMVGNKCDLETHRQISRTEAESLANSWGIPYYECSARNHQSINQIFHELVRLIRQFQWREKQPSKQYLTNGNGAVNGEWAASNSKNGAISHDKIDGIGKKRRRENCTIQ